MDSSHYKGLTVVTADLESDPLSPYWLSEIVYHPVRTFYATVGFAMFEDREQDRDLIIRFAPQLEFLDALSSALGGKPIQTQLMRARPAIERMISSSSGIQPLLFPQEFHIPIELRFLPPRRFESHNLSQEADRKEKELFHYLNRWSDEFECRKRKNHGYHFLRRNLKDAFLRLWRRKELKKKVSVERFIPQVKSLRTIYLAYAHKTSKVFKLFHPVSIVSSPDSAELLATNWPTIRNGLQNELGFKCELNAIVETVGKENKIARIACDAMREVEIAISSTSALTARAAQAQEGISGD